MSGWLRASVRTAAGVLSLLGLACGDPSGPPVESMASAVQPTTVTVTAIAPDAVVQDTTLDIRVNGSGFDRGSLAEFLRDGVVDPRVRTNSTRYVKTTELIANVTVALDAVPTRYDVRVTTSRGKKGIGTELLAVLPVNPEIAWSNGGIWVMNRDGSYKAQVASSSNGNPSWSPDGDGTPQAPYRLAYSPSAVGSLNVVDVVTTSGRPVGSAPRRIVSENAGYAAWSPIGGEIAFLSEGRIEIVREDGSARTVAYAPAYPAIAVQPTWRWDGLQIAFIEDDDLNVLSPNRTIRIISRPAVGQPWSAPVTVYSDGQRNGGLGMLDWGHAHDWLLMAPNGVVSKLDLNAPTGLIPIVSGGFSRWSPDDQDLVVQTSGKVVRYNLAARTTTTIAQKVTCCRPAWRVQRMAP
jgi:hypothetical protein